MQRLTREHQLWHDTAFTGSWTRYDEIKRESEGLGWTLFVEQEVGAHWCVRTGATYLFGRVFAEMRQKYDGPGSTEPLEEIERPRSPRFVSLSFRRSVGG